MLKSPWPCVVAAAGLVALCCISQPSFASYAIYVGKNLTTDGSVLIGGSGDEVSSHWLEVVPGAAHSEGASIAVGVTAGGRVSGAHDRHPAGAADIPLPHDELFRLQGFPGAAHQRRAQRAQRGRARRLVTLATGTRRDDAEPAERPAVQRSLAHRDAARAQRARGGADHRRA